MTACVRPAMVKVAVPPEPGSEAPPAPGSEEGPAL